MEPDTYILLDPALSFYGCSGGRGGDVFIYFWLNIYISCWIILWLKEQYKIAYKAGAGTFEKNIIIAFKL